MRNILVVDDEPIERSIIVEILKDAGRFSFKEASDGFQAVEIFRHNDFDAVVLDLKMKGKDGIETMTEMKGIDPSVPVIILTGSNDVHSSVRAMKKGAYDYIIKPPEFKDLCNLLCRAVKTKDLEREQKKDSRILADLLTSREKEVITCISEGLSDKQVADRMHISSHTVQSYIKRIFLKLGINSRTAMLGRCSNLLECIYPKK